MVTASHLQKVPYKTGLSALINLSECDATVLYIDRECDGYRIVYRQGALQVVVKVCTISYSRPR